MLETFLAVVAAIVFCVVAAKVWRFVRLEMARRGAGR
jgi:hypothetical protein